MLVTRPARNPPAHPISRINDGIDIPHSDMTARMRCCYQGAFAGRNAPRQRARSCETPLRLPTRPTWRFAVIHQWDGCHLTPNGTSPQVRSGVLTHLTRLFDDLANFYTLGRNHRAG
jgi:hypothetical protein